MKTVGEMLKKEREKQHRTLLEISKSTYISIPHLQALEENNFALLPTPVSVQGFLTTYAEELQIPTQTVLALLRRDFAMKNDSVVPVSTISMIPRHAKQERIWMILSIFVTTLLILVGYGGWSYQRLHQPPDLVITTPTENMQVKSPVVIRGRTASDAVVEIDTQSVAVTQDGAFAFEEDLLAGTHTITVIAKNRQGSQTLKQVVVQVHE